MKKYWPVLVVVIVVPLLGQIAVSTVNWTDHTDNSLLSRTGIICTGVALAIALFASIPAIHHYFKIHSVHVADPNSIPGKALRAGDMTSAQAPTATARSVRDGDWGSVDGLKRD